MGGGPLCERSDSPFPSSPNQARPMALAERANRVSFRAQRLHGFDRCGAADRRQTGKKYGDQQKSCCHAITRRIKGATLTSMERSRRTAAMEPSPRVMRPTAAVHVLPLNTSRKIAARPEPVRDQGACSGMSPISITTRVMSSACARVLPFSGHPSTASSKRSANCSAGRSW
jgi:hypothetical protein